MNQLLKITLLFVLIVLLPFGVMARGVENKTLGVGVNLGEPIGLSARLHFFDQLALDLVTGYGFDEKAFIIQPSLLFYLRGILDYNGRNYSLIPYFGAGFKTGVVTSGRHDGDGVAAMRFPIGASIVLKEGTFEISAEFAPGVEFNPKDDFDATGGIGLRYYFF